MPLTCRVARPPLLLYSQQLGLCLFWFHVRSNWQKRRTPQDRCEPWNKGSQRILRFWPSAGSPLASCRDTHLNPSQESIRSPRVSLLWVLCCQVTVTIAEGFPSWAAPQDSHCQQGTGKKDLSSTRIRRFSGLLCITAFPSLGTSRQEATGNIPFLSRESS